MDVVSLTTFCVVSWILAGLSVAVTIGRYIIHYTDKKRLFWDDVAQFCALWSAIGVIICFQLMIPRFPILLGMLDGSVPVESPEEVETFLLAYLRLQHGVSVLFYICLYFVKLSFLLFYRALFVSSEMFNKLWWGVSIFTAVTFIVCAAGTLTVCGPGNSLENVPECEAHNNNQIPELIYTAVVNIVSDASIIFLPFYMLGRLQQISRPQKIGLGVLFGLASIVIGLEIFRLVIFLDGSSQSNLPNAGLMTSIEINIALIISCMPAYRSLLPNERKWKARHYDNEKLNLAPDDAPTRSAPPREPDWGMLDTIGSDETANCANTKSAPSPQSSHSPQSSRDFDSETDHSPMKKVAITKSAPSPTSTHSFQSSHEFDSGMDHSSMEKLVLPPRVHKSAYKPQLSNCPWNVDPRRFAADQCTLAFDFSRSNRTSAYSSR